MPPSVKVGPSLLLAGEIEDRSEPIAHGSCCLLLVLGQNKIRFLAARPRVDHR
jgi:hypothetical protein